MIDASFEEKSTWIQLASVTVALTGYFVIAARMLLAGIDVLAAYVPLFVLAVLVIIAINVVGHVVIAIVSRPQGRDERDRVIAWRSEHHSSWLLAVGVLTAITGLVVAVPSVWIAHLLLLSLFLAELLGFALRIYFYRRGFT